MNMNKAICAVCTSIFELNDKQKLFIESMKNIKFIMIDCPNCGSSTQYLKDIKSMNNEDVSYSCPEDGCNGEVSHVIDASSDFWGCGECGSTWKNDDSLK